MTHEGLALRPISIAAARVYVRQWHRHLKPPQGARFAIAAYKGGVVVAVALVGNPARNAQDGTTAEVIRVASDGTRNACSFLYSRAKRAAQALGFVRVLTKTRPDESGDSMRAVQATFLGKTDGGSYDRTYRRRLRAAEYQGEKLRWQL